MPRARDTRLARLAKDATRIDSAQTVDRCALSAWAKVCAVVKDRLAQWGVDPPGAGALHLGEPAAPRPADLGDTGELRRADEELAASGRDGLAGIFAAKISDMARGYQDGREPDFRNASLAELFVWSLVRPTRGPRSALLGGSAPSLGREGE
jgi:hypothetical protein